MSIRVMTRVWEFSTAKEGTLLILLAIADFADDQGRAFPSMERLAKKARMTRRNAQLAIRRLQRTGEVLVDIGAGPKGCNLFRVSLATRVQETLGGEGYDVGGRNLRPKGVKPTSPKPSVPVNNRQEDFSITTTGYVYDPADYEGHRRWRTASK
jgi:hypothetical protein